MTASSTLNKHPSLKDIQSAVAALQDKKAEDIRVLDVSAQSSITDFLILATGTSEPHVKALKAVLDTALKESGVQLMGQDREIGSGWLVVDAFDFMVHLQTETMRDFYRLDQLWSDAHEIHI
ncbi:MAG: Ribosomal silencing factor RsfS [Opitutia bacterium UBA7350]|nr:MAG: Ribosomal silencing factor RsfS [Opitutae bacterium UBA7350]